MMAVTLTFESMANRSRVMLHRKNVHMIVRVGLLVMMVAIQSFEHSPILYAQSDRPVTVRLRIERVKAIECFDSIGNICVENSIQFYAKVKMGDEQFPDSPLVSGGNNDISPDWQFSKSIDLSNDSLNMKIQIWDRDPPGDPDDLADLVVGGFDNKDLDLTVNLGDCLALNSGAVTGNFGLIGNCGQSIISQGDDDNKSLIQFGIIVESPPSTPGTNVRCIHDPIWPQPSDSVTFSAEALDGNLSHKFANMDIEIWVNSTQSPAATSLPNQFSLTTTAGPFVNGATIFYGCLIRDKSSGEEVWTGWRKVQVGPPAHGSAVPILYTGSRGSSVDIVFIPDLNDYPGGATDSGFLNDVRTAIQDGYYASAASSVDVFLKNQDKLNFWIAQDPGVAGDSTDVKNVIEHVLPDNWNRNYIFADAGTIVHTRNNRDFARIDLHIFSAQSTPNLTKNPFPLVVVHETGHSPFGLADEYCCDGGYFQSDLYPNVYDTVAACQTDPLATTIDACTQYTSTNTKKNYYRLDSLSTYNDDLMTDTGPHTPQAADLRRINWFFEECRKGQCGANPVTAAQTISDAKLGPHEQPVPEFDFNDERRLMVVHVKFDELGTAMIDSTEIVNGYPYAQFGDPPLLNVKLLNDGDQMLDTFNAWNPLIETRETPRSDTTRFVFPFTPDLKKMEIINVPQQKVIGDIDLKPAINNFCAQNANDAVCAVDLAMAVHNGVSSAIAGQKLTYTVNIVNPGPVAVTGLTLTDTLPLGVIYDPRSSAPNCTGTDSRVICHLNTFANSTSLTLPIVVFVDPTLKDGAELVSQLELKANQDDPNLSNNSTTVQTSVVRRTDLAIRNTSPADPAIAGTVFTLQLAVENQGPSSATAAAVEAALPASITFQSAGSSAGCLAMAEKVQCAAGDLAPGAATTLTLQVALDPDLPEAPIDFPATVQASEADPQVANNSIVVTQPVERRTDLALSELSTASPVIAGSAMTYTFTITNLGPSTSSASQLLDELPQGMTLQSSTPASTCAVDGKLTRCGVGTLRPGRVQTVTLNVNIDPSIEVNAGYHNHGAIIASETDPIAANNQTVSSVWIVRRNVLTVIQKLLTDNVLPGALLDYEVTVRNSGDSMATGLKLYNTLPVGTHFDATHSSPNCTARGREVTCDLGSLLDQSQSSVHIYALLDKDVAGWTKLRNEATLVANELGDAKVQSHYESNVTGFLYLPLIQHAGETTTPGEIDLVVDSINISEAGVIITVRNAGTAPLLPSNSFWLDLYVNPDLPPSQPGQVWSDLGLAGMAWGVQSEALRLHPGEVMTLTVGDRYYDANFSQVPASLAAGTQIYVQVDSVNKSGVTYGNVLEGHEVHHEPYNNIKSISLTETVSTESWPVKSSLEGPSASSASGAGLPQRK